MKSLVLLCCLVLISFFSKSQTPVAYYPFTGNANDAAGSLNGTVNGATLTTDRFGNANSAYSFDGVDDFIGTTGTAISQNQNWTISAWVKAGSLSQSAAILVNGNSTATAGNGYGMHVLNTDITGPGNFFYLHYPGQVLINSGFTFNNINTWHHVVITRDANAIGKMYFDGVLSATTTTASINPAGGDFRIGSATNNGFWNGAIDEVKVYNNALTDAQVQQEFLASSFAVSTNTITGSPFCVGSSVSVPFTGSGTFNVGNTFTAQLSDVTGSFGSPVDIGFINSTTSGTITATIPIAQTAGTQYRIRVVSSDPVIVGTDNGTDLTVSSSVSPVTTHTKSWIGGTGNWDNPLGWSPCGVPNGASNVVLGGGDNVFIPTGTTANALSVNLSAGADLTIGAGGLLRINGSATDGITLTGSGTTVVNNGQISLGDFVGITKIGISLFSGSSFTNNNTAIVNVDNVTSTAAAEGIGISVSSTSTFTNSGTVNIGKTIAISRIGMLLSTGGKFINQIPGIVEVNRITAIDGIQFSGAGSEVNNSGIIRIGNLAAINASGITVSGSGQLINNTNALIDIDRITGSVGINMSAATITNGGTIQINGVATVDGMSVATSSTVTNTGTIKVGNSSAVKRSGISLFSASTFTNSSGALIEIDNISSATANEGRGLAVNNAGSSFVNAGTLKIGKTSAINQIGLFVGLGQFTNQSTGVVEINRTTVSSGITGSGTGSIMNAGSIKIGNISALQQRGISLSSAFTFTNQANATVEINRVNTSSAIGMANANTSLSNAGTIKIGNQGPVADGIFLQTGALLNNQTGSTIEIDNVTSFDALSSISSGTIINNAGTIKIGELFTGINNNGIYILGGSEMNNNTGGIIRIGSTLNEEGIRVSDASSKFANNATITIGIANPINGNGIHVQSGGLFQNGSSGTIHINNITDAASAGIRIEGNTSAFNNAGTINLAVSGSPIPDGIFNAAGSSNLVNTGTINFGNNISGVGVSTNSNLQNNSGGLIQTGTSGLLSIMGSITNSSNAVITNSITGDITLTNGASIVNSGTVNNNNTITNNGTFSLQTGAAVLNNNPGASFTNNGIVKGIGTIVQNGGFSNTTGSSIQPGLSPGTLSVTGNFDLGNGSLMIEANGITAGTFDVLNVSGMLTLSNARLNVTNGFSPAVGNSITIINASALTGTFATTIINGWFENYNEPGTGQVTLSFGGVLPLSLVSFSGNKQSNNAQLQWLTANEVNVSHFELQRSGDGQNFVAIGTIQPGSSSYSYTDINIFNTKSVVFYRLRSVDIDGKFTLSPVIRLSSQLQIKMTVFPNPVQNVVTISGLKQNGTLRLYSMDGKLLQQQTITSLSTTMSMAGYTNGMYFLQYQQENGAIVNQKIIKQ